MQDIDSFLPDVRTYVPDVPDLLAYRMIREVAKAICRRTRQWREWDDFTVSTPGDESLCSISDAAIFEIESASLDGAKLTPVTTAYLDEKVPGWESDTEVAAARYVTQLGPDRIILYPNATGAVRVRLVLEPSRDAMSLPDFLLDHHSALVGTGAAGRLLILPKTDFENPNLGAALIKDFKADLDTVASRAVKGQQKAPIRTKASFF